MSHFGRTLRQQGRGAVAGLSLGSLRFCAPHAFCFLSTWADFVERRARYASVSVVRPGAQRGQWWRASGRFVNVIKRRLSDRVHGRLPLLGRATRQVARGFRRQIPQIIPNHSHQARLHGVHWRRLNSEEYFSDSTSQPRPRRSIDHFLPSGRGFRTCGFIAKGYRQLVRRGQRPTFGRKHVHLRARQGGDEPSCSASGSLLWWKCVSSIRSGVDRDQGR